jgi:hypothetical protein
VIRFFCFVTSRWQKAIPRLLPARFAIIPKAFSEARRVVQFEDETVRYKTEVEFYKDRTIAMYESDERNDALEHPGRSRSNSSDVRPFV